MEHAAPARELELLALEVAKLLALGAAPGRAAGAHEVDHVVQAPHPAVAAREGRWGAEKRARAGPLPRRGLAGGFEPGEGSGRRLGGGKGPPEPDEEDAGPGGAAQRAGTGATVLGPPRGGA